MRVLSFGYVEEFLRERHELLVSAGLQVTSVGSKSEAIKLLETNDFNVLLVGHGVPAEQRNQVALRAKLWSKILVIFLYRWNISNAECADAVLSVDGCADHLLETICRIPAREERTRHPNEKSDFSISPRPFGASFFVLITSPGSRDASFG